MIKSLILITTTLLITGTLNGQSINKLYESLSIPNGWKAELSINSEFISFYDKGKVGVITFSTKNKFVELMIFKKEVLNDSLFSHNYNLEDAESSCRNFNTNENYTISSFSTTDYYIIPRLCPVCNFENDSKCKKLAKSISDWILKQMKTSL